MQLGNALLQGRDGLLLGGGVLLQLLEVLLLPVLVLLEVLHTLQDGPEQRLVGQRFQREIPVGDHQLHPGGVVSQPFQPVVGVVAQKEGGVALQLQAVGRHAEDAVIREEQLRDAAGQLARVKAQGLRGHGQLKGGGDGPRQLIADVVRGSEGVPLREAEARIVIEQRLQEGGGIGVHLALGVGGAVAFHLFFQRQAAGSQTGDALVCAFELLFQVRNAAAQSRFRSFVHHYRGLLRFIARRTTRAASPCIKSNYSLPSKWLDTKAQEFQCFAA